MVEGRRLLELRHEALQAALPVEEIVDRLEAAGGGRRVAALHGGGERAPEEAKRGGCGSHALRLEACVRLCSEE